MKGVFLGLIILIVLIVLYFRSCSGFTKEPGQAPTEVVPTQLPPVAPTPPTPVTEPSPVQPQPIPDVQPTTSMDGFPESLSMSSFVVNGSDLSEVDTMTEEIKLVKLKGPETEDIDMERRQLYTEWNP